MALQKLQSWSRVWWQNLRAARGGRGLDDNIPATHGYQFVSIDDGWEGQRDSNGVLQPNEKFPDIHDTRDLGTFADRFTTRVPAHGAVLIKVGRR